MNEHLQDSMLMQKALKDKHDWRRVGREIRILKRLKNHPAIIHMYDVVSMPSEVFVIQELAQGGSLLDYIRDRKRVSESLAVRFFLQIVAGLQYCHDREVLPLPCFCSSSCLLPALYTLLAVAWVPTNRHLCGAKAYLHVKLQIRKILIALAIAGSAS
jgi:serine/threonine protein kinase